MTIIHKPDKRRGAAAAAAGDAQSDAAPRVDRKVANCLCCGKVYQLQDGSSDVKALIGARSPELQRLKPVLSALSPAAQGFGWS